MINNIVNYLKDKKIAILGFGLEGKSTLNFILKHLPNKEVTVIDKNTNIEKITNDNVSYVLGDDYLDHLNDFDLVIKTPGISLVDKTFNSTITSQWALFLSNTESKVIGITGTKGKSTTTSLIYEIIKAQHDNTYLVGNIGIPLFDYIDDFDSNTIVVAELSAHQLYDVKKSPNISIITNFYEEHLDYYHTLANYYNSKLNIFKYQSADDYAIYLEDNEELNNSVNDLNISSIKIPLGEKNIVDNKIVLDKEVFDLNSKRHLLGHFNDLNIMMALEVAKILNLDLDKARSSICAFEGLDHRMKKVAEINGISFYDDTLATIPAASINSVKSIPNVKTLILGGMDRNINYDSYIKDLKESGLNSIICQPDTGKYIYDALNGNCDKALYYIEDLEDAVQKAYEVTSNNEAVLLSPAAPSYNVYKNYADKSEHYIRILNKIK
jgi:UDP-N-acetylmuramoylalanine--D-glutamate ligase